MMQMSVEDVVVDEEGSLISFTSAPSLRPG